MARVTGPGDPDKLPSIKGSSLSWGPTFPYTSPIDADFSWINQGTSTITDQGGSLALVGQSGGGLRIRKKSAPSAPYTIDIAYLCNGPNVDFISAGFCWRQSSDSKLVTWGYNVAAATCAFQLFKYTNETTFSANYSTMSIRAGFGQPFFVRAEDDATLRRVYFSSDGQNWTLWHSVSRTDFMTADEVGFFVSSALTTTLTLLHWKQS